MLAQALYQTGLLQFGVFHTSDGVTMPYRLRLELLAAYPALLKSVASNMQAYLAGVDIEQLVSASDAIPLGSIISNNMALPFVYSIGCDNSPAHDFVGSYDVGHPATLITNTISAHTEQLIHKAAKVGLDIHTICSIVDDGYTLSSAEVTIHAVLTLPEILVTLTDEGILSVNQREATLAALKTTDARS